MDLGALEGAGSIYSTAGDMVTYLAANLHPDSAAIAASHELRAAALPGLKIALGLDVRHRHGSVPAQWRGAGTHELRFLRPAWRRCRRSSVERGRGVLQYGGRDRRACARAADGQASDFTASGRQPAGGGGVSGSLRLFADWWFTMLMAGAFIYCCILGVQGLAAELLPRRYFLRVSSWLQLAAFGIVVGTYFLEPKLLMPQVVAASYGSPYVAWSPSYWFLGLFRAVERISGAGGSGAAGVDRDRYRIRRDGLGLHARVSSHHAEDCRRARYRARICRPKLAAGLRRRLRHGGGTVRCPDGIAQPATSSDADVLSGRGIRGCDLFPEDGGGSPIRWETR